MEKKKREEKERKWRETGMRASFIRFPESSSQASGALRGRVMGIHTAFLFCPRFFQPLFFFITLGLPRLLTRPRVVATLNASVRLPKRALPFTLSSQATRVTSYLKESWESSWMN